jgi:hypothetical protein
MSGVLVTPPVAVTPQEHMARYLDVLADGLWPDGACAPCRNSLADKCPEHAKDLADINALTAAIDAVHQAPTEGQARAAYVACLLGLIETHGGAQ